MILGRYRGKDFGSYKRGMGVFLILAIFLSPLAPVYAQGLAYEYLIELGEKYFEKGDYEQAGHYFTLAQLVNPSCKEAIYYMNLMKRSVEGRIIYQDDIDDLQRDILLKKKTEALKAVRGEGIKKEKMIEDVSRMLERGIDKFDNTEQRRKLIAAEGDRKKKVLAELDKTESRLEEEITEKKEPPAKRSEREVERKPAGIRKDKSEHKVKEGVGRKKEEAAIVLTAEIKDKFPLSIDLPYEESFIVRSEAIKRFLVVTPGIIAVEKIDNSSLKITGEHIGSTFLHVWDGQGRWTFYAAVVHHRRADGQEKEKAMWEDVDSFTVQYNSNWRSYYKGGNLRQLERKSLGFNQSARLIGPTPYGELRGGISWARLDKEQEVTGYNLGLHKGRLFGFDDFSIRGFDVSESFSPLTLPGKSLSGVVFKSPAFNKKIEYTLVHGKEETSYGGSVSPGVSSGQDSYIDGVRWKFSPDKSNDLFLNYAQSRGGGRQEYLKDKAFSLQSEHNLDKLAVSSEIASDEHHIAAKFFSSYRLPKLNLRLSLRDIEKDFVTISGRPGNRGEIGGKIGADWSPLDRLSLGSNLDIYRDRHSPNPEDPQAVNYYWGSSLGLRIDPTSRISTNMYYSNTRGLSSPQKALNFSTTYNKRFDLESLGNRQLSTHLGYSYYQSKYLRAAGSSYRRDSLLSGLRLNIIENLFYYLNYNLSWVDEISAGEESESSVMDTGISYHYRFKPDFSSNLRLFYRDEEKKASGDHSLLAGEDSMEGAVSLIFNPKKDAEFFLDGRIRNVWPEDSIRDKFLEMDVTLGTRLSWDTFFRWAPKTEVSGVVFKDFNGNGLKDEGEEGIPQVKVTVGPQETSADEEGNFAAVVMAKKVIVSIDINTVPEGYIFTTPTSLEIDTSKGGVETAAFGLSTRSGIYGVVFYDANDNGELDKEDLPISGVKITMDKKKATVTNGKGVYFFSDISVGKYTVVLDVNSLPLEYLPKISVRKDIEIQEGFTYTHHIPLKKRESK